MSVPRLREKLKAVNAAGVCGHLLVHTGRADANEVSEIDEGDRCAACGGTFGSATASQKRVFKWQRELE